jgi:peroxisome proliferator-activated receptor gamma coactivator-related protein 1
MPGYIKQFFFFYFSNDNEIFCFIEGNTIAGEEHFDLCFGGRRQFCETEYADLGL